MSELSITERLKETLETCELQRNKLKLCRLTMREYGIGHLYPGATVEYEEDMKKSMEGMETADTQGLYKAAKLHQFQFESANKKLKKLLNFIESKGISAQELQDYMIENTKILVEDELEVEENNLQTQSLEDGSHPRR